MAVNFYDSEEAKFGDLKAEISRGLRTLLLDKVQRIADADSNKIVLSTGAGGIKESDKGPDDFAPAFAGSAADRILLSTGDGGIKESDRTATEFLTRFRVNTPGKILTTDVGGGIVESKAKVGKVGAHVDYHELAHPAPITVTHGLSLTSRRALRDIKIKSVYARVILEKRGGQRVFIKLHNGRAMIGKPFTLPDSADDSSTGTLSEEINERVSAGDQYQFSLTVSQATTIRSFEMEWVWEYR